MRHHPESPGSGWLVVAVFSLFGFLATVLAISALQTYGWTLFVGLPFALGFMPVLIRSANRRPGFGECFLLTTVPVSVVALLMFFAAMEGAICLVMATPIWLGVSWFGGAVAFLIHLGLRPYGWSQTLVIGLMLAIPGLMGTEAAFGPAPPVKPVTTSVIVNASPQSVWDELIAFDALPEERHWLFRTGVAYPVRAKIIGRGVGAVRHCVFSTGAFVEPIEVWDEPRLLRFSVTENPPPMQEWSIYTGVHAPHLEGFMVSRRGQFKLTPLLGGRTHLEGTTWYQHGLWPERYWRLFSDYIIHRIHVRVLEHIKAAAERRRTHHGHTESTEKAQTRRQESGVSMLLPSPGFTTGKSPEGATEPIVTSDPPSEGFSHEMHGARWPAPVAPQREGAGQFRSP